MEGLALTDSLDDSCGDVGILIGSDYYWYLVSGETIRGDSGPTAVSSIFGWLLSGPLRDSVAADSISSNLIISEECPFAAHKDEELVNTLEKFWKTESTGIQSGQSDTCQSVKEFVKVRHNGQRYEAELPFKDDCLPIRDNYSLCYNRLKSMHFKLTKIPDILPEQGWRRGARVAQW